MAYESPHGKPEGLRKRLDDWARRMSNNDSLPWAGLRIIEDIKLAVTLLPKGPPAPIKDFDL